MKRIATITYSRAYNYGSALQTYALNRYLRELGNDVKTIDYTTEDQQKLYTIFEPIKGLMSVFRNLQSVFCYNDLKRHKYRFDRFLKEFIPMTQAIQSKSEFKELNKDFDLFVCGSDQIWNAQCDDFDSNYMLSFVTEKNKCIAYAPSLGAGANDKRTTDALSKFSKDFKAISSREKASCQIISSATGRNVTHVLDPVYLLNAQQWDEVSTKCPVDGDFILGYFIGDVVGMRDFASALSKEANLPVIVIYKSIRDVKYRFHKCYDAGPEEFVSLVRNAKYVVTNSFHAVSFSLIYGVSFWAFVQPGSADERLRSILEITGLSNRIVDFKTSRTINKKELVDYTKANMSNLEAAINNSKTFLKENVNYGAL